MNQNQVTASLAIVAVSNGTTVNGYVRVDNGPLIQAWTKGSDKYTPDFEALAEDKRPIVIVVLRDVSSGRILIPSKLVFKYNGTELAFGEDGLCNTEQFAGTFKRVTGYNVSVDSQSYPMTGLRVMKNLVPISGYDNDRITVSGEVEIGGHTVAFNELATDVVIQESSGKQYELFITSDKGTQIINPSEVLTLKASLYSGGDLINDLGNITLQWKKQLPSGEANLGTQGTQNIAANDIDGSLVVSCEAVQNAKVIAKGFITVFDLSDPILAAFKVKGLASDGQIYPGETGTLTPYAYKRQWRWQAGTSPHSMARTIRSRCRERTATSSRARTSH